MRRVVDGAAAAGVGNAYDDWLDLLGAQGLHSFVYLPLTGVAAGGVEQILSIVHVEDGVALLGYGIGGRQIDEQPTADTFGWAIKGPGNLDRAHDRVLPTHRVILPRGVTARNPRVVPRCIVQELISSGSIFRIPSM